MPASGQFEINTVITNWKALGSKLDSETGINLKYGITSDLTADVTVNPDFSQVESDLPQITVNERFEVQFPEKRPFFLEDRSLFQTPGAGGYREHDILVITEDGAENITGFPYGPEANIVLA